MQDAEMIKIIRELLVSQRLAVLSTQDHGQPYINLIAFAATDDLKYLYFATNRATRKYANLMADSRASLLIDTLDAAVELQQLAQYAMVIGLMFRQAAILRVAH